MVDEVGHAGLPPLDALLCERNLGRELADSVLTSEKGEIPDCVEMVSDVSRKSGQLAYDRSAAR